MTITIPDETARRIEAVAAARSDTIEHVTIEALDASPLLIELVYAGDVDLGVPVFSDFFELVRWTCPAQ